MKLVHKEAEPAEREHRRRAEWLKGDYLLKVAVQLIMKIVIISDIHGNLEALNAFQEGYDELWVLGDLVNYGPNPIETIEWVRKRASVIVRGDHDHAIGFNEKCRCSDRFNAMAESTRKCTDRLLGAEEKSFLRELPETICRRIGTTTFFLCHATPSNPIFEYRQADSPKWDLEGTAIGANVLLAGHTHVPFVREFGDRVVANPGSIGQSKAGDSKAHYAIWQDGRIELKSYRYPLEETVARIRKLSLPDEIKSDLAGVLRTGCVQARP
jgi:putative phosphoesterase